MLVMEERTEKPVRTRSRLVSSIIMIAQPSLIAESLVEVLAKNFTDHEVIRYDDLHEMPEGLEEDVSLVLAYRPSREELLEIVERFGGEKPDAAIGVMVASLDEAEGLFSKSEDADIIDGVVPLDLRLDVFLATIRLLAKGGEHFPSALLQRLRSAAETIPGRRPFVTPVTRRSDPDPDPMEIALTTREVQIVDLLCKGTQNKIIADKLHLSENTVKVHIRNIYKKMRVRNRTEAASHFFQHDIFGIDKPTRKN